MGTGLEALRAPPSRPAGASVWRVIPRAVRAGARSRVAAQAAIFFRHAGRKFPRKRRVGETASVSFLFEELGASVELVHFGQRERMIAWPIASPVG